MARHVRCGRWVTEERSYGTVRESCKLEPNHDGPCQGFLVGKPPTEICERCGGYTKRLQPGGCTCSETSIDGVEVIDWDN